MRVSALSPCPNYTPLYISTTFLSPSPLNLIISEFLVSTRVFITVMFTTESFCKPWYCFVFPIQLLFALIILLPFHLLSFLCVFFSTLLINPIYVLGCLPSRGADISHIQVILSPYRFSQGTSWFVPNWMSCAQRFLLPSLFTTCLCEILLPISMASSFWFLDQIL